MRRVAKALLDLADKEGVVKIDPKTRRDWVEHYAYIAMLAFILIWLIL